MWQSTEPSLLLRLRDPDDQAAWVDFDQRYGELILRYCQRLGLSTHDAEDVRQIVLLSLAKVFPRFEYSPERGRFRSYLAAVVRRAVARYVRRPKTVSESLGQGEGGAGDERALVEIAAGAAAAGELDPQWELEWQRHHLRLALRKIRKTFEPKSIEIFERLLAGESVERVAGEMSVSAASVYKVKQRIRNAMRALIARQIEEEERFFV